MRRVLSVVETSRRQFGSPVRGYLPDLLPINCGGKLRLMRDSAESVQEAVGSALLIHPGVPSSGVLLATSLCRRGSRELRLAGREPAGVGGVTAFWLLPASCAAIFHSGLWWA